MFTTRIGTAFFWPWNRNFALFHFFTHPFLPHSNRFFSRSLLGIRPSVWGHKGHRRPSRSFMCSLCSPWDSLDCTSEHIESATKAQFVSAGAQKRVFLEQDVIAGLENKSPFLWRAFWESYCSKLPSEVCHESQRSERKSPQIAWIENNILKKS